MVRLRIILLLAVFSLSLPLKGQKYENLGKTPQMGWNSWNKFSSNINETLIRETSDLMVSKGLLDAGTYISILTIAGLVKGILSGLSGKTERNFLQE